MHATTYLYMVYNTSIWAERSLPVTFSYHKSHDPGSPILQTTLTGEIRPSAAGLANVASLRESLKICQHNSLLFFFLVCQQGSSAPVAVLVPGGSSLVG